MSTHEHENGAPLEQRSRIKVVMNAKHEPQWEVSVVAGESAEELERLRHLAVAQHHRLVAELLHGRHV